ncbi:MAG: hypothetical protein KDD50_13610 [Bdellovibrionales bacterium]|nr:hypothetical protein [Bdellovibrionales bacterium]
MLILGVNILGTVFAGISAKYQLGWSSAFLNIFGLTIIYNYVAFTEKNVKYIKWAYLGILVGFVEVIADYWLVSGIHVLDYDPGGLFILKSPSYMPFSWAGMIITFGSIGQWIENRSNFWMASLLSALLMSLYVPLYEEIAFAAGWWSYKDTPMLGHVPYFIILGEFFIGLPLLYLANKISTSSFKDLAILSVFAGLWIFISYSMAYYILDKGLLAS